MKKYGLLMIAIAVLALMTACGSQNQNGGTITIIKGEPAEMPDVTNATLASATETLSEAGFTNVISEYYGGTVRNPERMVVTGQSCPAGESVDRYTEIILTCRKLCGVNLDITSKNNWIFSKYDMLVKFDGRELGKVANGETLTVNLDIVEGSYVLQVLNADDPSLAAEYQLEVTEDMGFACRLSHSDKEIRFNKVVLDVGKPVDAGEAEDVNETEDAGKAEDVNETEDAGKAEDVNETEDVNEAKDARETANSGVAEKKTGTEGCSNYL